MPPRWPRQPDRQDPDYRRLDDRMNFAVHVALFAAVNSGLWFFQTLGRLEGATWVGLGWGTALFLHGVYIFALAQYNPPDHSPHE